MEVTESTEASQQKQVYDIVNDKYVDNPLLKKVEETEEEPEAEDTEKETQEEVAPKKGAKKTENEDSDEDSEEESEEESDEEEPEVDSDDSEEEEEKDTPESKDDDVMDPDDYVAHAYGEKFKVKTEAELTSLIENAIDTIGELETLKKENATLKAEAGKPKFKSDKEQKAFEFLSQFDIDRQGEALDTFAKILGMDVEKTDGKLLQEEAFIHRNRNKWTRAEAQKMFAREYSKYTLKREAFDGSDEEYQDQLDYLKTLEKGEAADAKAYLLEQKSKYKPTEKEAPKANEAVESAIKKNAVDYEAHVKTVKDLSFGEGDDKFTFELDADQAEKLSGAIGEWVRNPANYTEKGELKGIKTPQQMIDAVSGALFMRDIIKSLSSRIRNQTNIKRADEFAKEKPQKRKSPAGSEAKVNKDDLDAQALDIIRKRKAA